MALLQRVCRYRNFLLSVSQMFYAVRYGYGVLSCETMLILKDRAET